VEAAETTGPQEAKRRRAALEEAAAALRAELATVQAQVHDLTAVMPERDLREDERAAVRRLLMAGERLRLALEHLERDWRGQREA
jgi:hypothetical protein